MSLLLELADAFFQPAYAVVIPQLVPEEALPSANSLTSLSVQIGRIIGPPLGALLLAIGGTATAFALNGFTFFLSALLLLPLLRRERQRSAIAPIPPSHSPLLDFREGIATVLRMPWLWMSILVYAMANVTLGGPYSVALPFLVEEQLSANVQTLGLLYALFAAGYALGGIWLGRKRQLPRRGMLIYGGLAIGGLMLLVVGLPIGLPLIAVAALLNGVAMEVSGLAWTNALQTLVPHEKLGRVTSIDAIGSMALMPIGFGLTGWAIEQWGSPTTIILGGGVTAVVALLMLWHPAIHRLD